MSNIRNRTFISPLFHLTDVTAMLAGYDSDEIKVLFLRLLILNIVRNYDERLFIYLVQVELHFTIIGSQMK